jgi:hypothetical protein
MEAVVIVGTACLSGLGGFVGRSVCDLMRNGNGKTKRCSYHEELSADVKSIKTIVGRLEIVFAVLEERLENLIERKKHD